MPGHPVGLETAIRALGGSSDTSALHYAPFIPRSHPRVPNPIEALNSALADRYRIERELGRGGMATVYLAEDLKHRRPVAIKVLKPELAGALGPDRFLREIEIAARLDHPHVLPLYDSGDAAGALYYVMPYVEGESLRDRLTREKQLPTEDALQIAREVADALSYAHSRDVVHRDIKPENILLAGGHARVADFGIARAITEAGGDRLTGTGLAIGTPAYMSPEQAAGSRDLDGRSDLYSLGCVLYEMLAGQPPFTGPLDSMVHQHLTVDAPPITNLRPAVPATVAAALMRVLAKTPADRFSPAAQFAEALRAAPVTGLPDVLPTPGGATRRDPVRAAGVFALASFGVLALVFLMVSQIGLPTWVFGAAVGLVVLGLPLVVLTSLAERRRAQAGGAGTGFPGWLTWRTTLLGGGLAFTALAVVTASYMAARVLGIGPAGTLLATGAIGERERVILADFENRTPDATHGATVTELMRIGLSRSQAVSVLDPLQVGRILHLVADAPADGVSDSVALHAAEREGIRAVVTGEIVSVGSGYSIAARLVSTSGEILTAQQVSAASEDQIVAAIDRLALALRERFGESLRDLRRARPLEQVTTKSQRGLRLFSQGLQAWNQGDNARAMQLLEEAIALDTTFAMAHRKLAIILSNNAERRSRAVEAATKAYQFRDRLTERERYLVIAAYHSVVTGNRDQVISAYRTVLDMYPDDHYALNNLGVIYSELRDYARAAEYYGRALAVDSATRLHYSNLAYALEQQRQFDSATVVVANFERRFPDNPEVKIAHIVLAAMRKDYDVAETLGAELVAEQRGTVFWEAIAYEWLAQLDAMRGRLAGAERRWERAFAITADRDLGGQYLTRTARRAIVERLLLNDPARAKRLLDDAVRRYPLDRLPPLDRPYGHLALAYAAAGETATATTLLNDFDRTPAADHGRDAEMWRTGAAGVAALAEGRPEEAIAKLWQFDEGNACSTCAAGWLARAYDQAGRTDSARVMYERLVETPSSEIWYDAAHVGHGYLRLAELAEQGGDRVKAAAYYNRFLALWNEADPRLQDWVQQARNALDRLGREPTGTE
ncbi:MAG: protein kinase [Gemmatimonadota bacterium]|nr:protein kinase [Gemmatimonadota bacterium]